MAGLWPGRICVVYINTLWYSTTTMTERSNKYEMLSAPEPERLEHGAVPLNPWTALEPDGKTHYSLASLQRIDRKVEQAINNALENGWVTSPEHAEVLRQFIATSLYNSQWSRLNLNPTIPSSAINDDDPVVVRAMNGTATPADLQGLLISNPEWMSLELAKLSHPLDATATKAMDTDVFSLFEEAHVISAEPEYAMRRLDPTIPAGVILRKQPLFWVEAPSGIIETVQCKSILVRGDSDVWDNDNMDRKIRNPERFEALKEEIEANLENHDLLWMQQIATSYFSWYP